MCLYTCVYVSMYVYYLAPHCYFKKNNLPYNTFKYNIFYIIVYDPPDQCTVGTVDEEYNFLLFQVSGLHFWVCKYSRLAFPQTV